MCLFRCGYRKHVSSWLTECCWGVGDDPSLLLQPWIGQVQPLFNQQSLEWYSLPSDVSTARYWSEFRRVKPEVVPLADQSHLQNPNLVRFQNKTCWFRAIYALIPEKVYAREIDPLIQMQKTGLSDQIRVPRLNGVVLAPKGDLISRSTT